MIRCNAIGHVTQREQSIYHSEATDGTLNTPQCMKIPILLSSYHLGNGRLSRDDQSGVYCCTVTGRREQHTLKVNSHTKNGDIASCSTPVKSQVIVTSRLDSVQKVEQIPA